MVRAYLREFHSPDGWELEADGGYHNIRDSCPGDWWEPKVHVIDLCEDEGEAGCVGSPQVVGV